MNQSAGRGGAEAARPGVSPDAAPDAWTLLMDMAREQGRALARQEADERQLAAQEARLAEIERTALVRIEELTKTNADLRETLALANGLLNELLTVCGRYGWTQASGVVALDWLNHVLSLGTVSGWPSVN